MAAPSISQIFESELSCSSKGHLGGMIRDHLERSCQEVSVDRDHQLDMNSPNPDGVLAELGEYLTRTAILWSVLTRNLLERQNLTTVARSFSIKGHETARMDSNLSDLSALTALDVNLSRLSKMKEISQRYCQEMQSIWHPEPTVPEPVGLGPSPFGEIFPPHQMALDTDMQSHMFKQRRLLPETTMTAVSPPATTLSEPEESSDDDEDQFRQFVDMERLKQRGKGVYYCPKGIRCDKGGVDKSGSLVQFDRNSSFAQHCNKHRKPWRCDLPGCPNPPKKRKFARRDGLERHKQTVKHHVIT